jgi:hypothetical protein
VLVAHGEGLHDDGIGRSGNSSSSVRNIEESAVLMQRA